MIRIGLVDLDTSHPGAFTKILKTIPGVDVTALWDGHDVWPPGYDRRFAAENGIPSVCEALEDMPGLVDAAMIHGVDWDKHCDRALVFMKEGIPVLIDKPVVGSISDCDRLMNMREKYGSTVFGGSSLRYAEEVTSLRTGAGPRTGIVAAAASGPGDFFSYGIHTTEMLQGFAGTGIRSVKPVKGGDAPVLAAEYDDGLIGLLHLQMPFHEWSLCAYTRTGFRTAVVDAGKLYEPFLRQFVALLRGGTAGDLLAGPVEAVRVQIAARVALVKGSAASPRDLPSDAGFDGKAFAAQYAGEKRRTSGTPQA